MSSLWVSRLNRYTRLLRSREPFRSARYLSGPSSTASSARTPQSPQDPFYITTPIFYVNAAPHIGHVYSMVLCDVQNRWQKFSGRQTFFTTGTDEHGLKVQAAAEAAGKPPKQFCDELSARFQSLAELSDVETDRFIRTTDADHIRAVTHFWQQLENKGHLYKGKHEGWYCVSDETFYPASQVIEETRDGVSIMVSKETGKEVSFTTEENWFFRMSDFQDQLIQFLETHPDWIVPKIHYDYVLGELRSGRLADLSVSRPLSRLQWGVPVPGSAEDTIYVWVDALVNYLTSVGYPEGFIDQSNGVFNGASEVSESLSAFWPPYHIIGKDIIKFHAIYWPTLLMAAGLPLPKQLIVHSHWISQGTKMSKSLGNVVDPVALLGDTPGGSDVLRFYLMENSVLEHDGDFSVERLAVCHDNLLNKVSNLLIRSLAPKFDARRLLSRVESGTLPLASTDSERLRELLQGLRPSKLADGSECSTEQLIDRYFELSASLNKLYTKMHQQMCQFDTSRALSRQFWPVLHQANQLMQSAAPWQYNGGEDSALILQDAVLFLMLETVRICSILLQPVCPKLATRLLDRLEVAQDKRTVADLAVGADLSYASSGSANRSGDHPMTRVGKKEEKKDGKKKKEKEKKVESS